MKLFIKGIAAASLFVLAQSASHAEPEVTLSVGSWAGPNHAINSVAFEKWASEIEERSGGEIALELSFPPVHPKLMYDRARTGINDITWGFNGYTPGRFAGYQVLELPGLGANSEQASVAYWRTHQKYLKELNEYRGVRLLSLFSQPPSVIHTRERIDSLADMEGKKLRAGGGIQGAVAESLGFVGVAAPVPEAYQLVREGVVDGTFFPVETAMSFNLDEVAPYQLAFEQGLFYGSYFLVMNENTYEQLSAEHQRIIDEVSGEYFSRLVGQAWDDADRKAIASLTSEEREGEYRVADEQLAGQVMSQLKGLEQQWYETASENGLQGREILEFLRNRAREAAAQ